MAAILKRQLFKIWRVEWYKEREQNTKRAHTHTQWEPKLSHQKKEIKNKTRLVKTSFTKTVGSFLIVVAYYYFFGGI